MVAKSKDLIKACFENVNICIIRDLFHVYLNKCEFYFLRRHINKTNTFCFFINNGRVPGMAK